MSSSFSKAFSLLSLFFLLALVAKAQYGLNLGHNPTLPGSQWVNPAHISQQGFDKFQIELSGNFWLANNRFSLEELVRKGNFISDESKDILISQLDQDNQFQQGNQTNVLLNFRLGQQKWLLSYQQGQSLHIGLGDSVSAGLLLRGNAPYAGTEISDEKIEWRNFSYRAIGTGTAWSNERFSWGFHVKLLQGIQSQFVDRLSYTLLTERDGSQIFLDANYDTYGTTEKNQGWGWGIDLGMRYTLSDHKVLDVSVNQAGRIHWEGSKSENEVSIAYEGVIWDNFLTNTASSNNLALGDTLQQLLFPDSVETTFSTPFPTFVRMAYTMGDIPSGRLGISLTQSLTKWAPSSSLPLFNIMYARGKENLNGGVNAYIGGMESYGLGLWGSGSLEVGREGKIGLYASMPNVLGLAIPEISRGLAVRGGLFVSW